MNQLQTITNTLPAYQPAKQKPFRVVVICGRSGTGKTDLGNYLYKDYKGPRLKTHIDARSKVVRQCDEKAATLLWVDECHSVVNTIREARTLGYKYVLICSQAPGETIRTLVERYGMPKGDYKIVDLSKVHIKS